MNHSVFDKTHIWHPYSALESDENIYEVERANGSEIILKNGKTLIDGMASWWCVINGYNHPRINRVAKKQLDQMSHVMFGGLTHAPAIHLTKKIFEFLEAKTLDRIFFSDSGSVSVEIAQKMAIQYHFSKNPETQKKKFLTFRGGYHGDTFRAMSVSDPETGMHHIYHSVLQKNFFLDRPSIGFYDAWDDEVMKNIEAAIKKHQAEVAAFIVEPVVQGAGGMWFYHPEYLNRMVKLCREHNILVIFDEIATGFGRTGKAFAFQYLNFEPDILCIGKALTGGYISLAATITTQHVAKTIAENPPGVLLHGPTFMANPLACSIAAENISVLQSYDWQKQVENIGKIFYDELKDLEALESVHQVRSLGGIGVVEMIEKVNMKKVVPQFVEKGLWVRPFNRLIYIMPPYTIEPYQLIKLIRGIREVVCGE